jgi:hypothetical protein
MPIRRSKSVLIDLYRRINRLVKEQRHRRDTRTRTPGAKQRLTDLFLPLTRKKNRPKPGGSKARTKD